MAGEGEDRPSGGIRDLPPPRTGLWASEGSRDPSLFDPQQKQLVFVCLFSQLAKQNHSPRAATIGSVDVPPAPNRGAAGSLDPGARAACAPRSGGRKKAAAGLPSAIPARWVPDPGLTPRVGRAGLPPAPPAAGGERFYLLMLSVLVRAWGSPRGQAGVGAVGGLEGRSPAVASDAAEAVLYSSSPHGDWGVA